MNFKRILIVLLCFFCFPELSAVASENCQGQLTIHFKSGASTQQLGADVTILLEDRFRIKVSKPINCHAALFWKDSLGQVNNITPSGTSEKLAALPDIYFPSQSGWVRLDNPIGPEEVVLVTASGPIDALKEIGLNIAFADVSTLSSLLSDSGYTVTWRRISPVLD